MWASDNEAALLKCEVRCTLHLYVCNVNVYRWVQVVDGFVIKVFGGHDRLDHVLQKLFLSRKKYVGLLDTDYNLKGKW